MADTNSPNVRRSIHAMQLEYEGGNKKPMEDLVRAWQGIQALPPSDERSFFSLGGYHGEPFQYRKAVDELDATDTYAYWGGYCNHGNILFPTWHRAYLFKLEQALQSIVPGVTLPYWDETEDHAMQYGVPSILTQETFTFSDGRTIPNPLQSFVLPVALSDGMPGDGRAYEKPAGYQTVRYPLSGLVGTAQAREQTAQHNAQYPDHMRNVALLNENIRAWLRGNKPTHGDPTPSVDGVYEQFRQCLDAPNYTVFSNTTSSSAWNQTNSGKVTSLESPHNDIHLAVGGFDMPGQGQSGQILGANGDMGENNTAGMDPVFFFHHCNIDRVFWIWQKRHEQTDTLTVLSGFPGTNANDEQGPTPGVAPGTKLTLASPLAPFKSAAGDLLTSLDCINIETQLGYTYAPGSFDDGPARSRLGDQRVAGGRKLHVSGINRSAYQGSFVLEAYATVDGADGSVDKRYLGHNSVLSRYNVARCANCLTHIEVMAHFPLVALTESEAASAQFHVELRSRTGTDVIVPSDTARMRLLPMNAATGAAPKTAEIRLIP